MKAVPSWEQLGLGHVSPARQCPPCATQGHQLPGCLHVAGIKRLWLAISGPHGPGHPGPELANSVHAKRPSQLCGSTGWQPAHQLLCLQLTCWAFPGCPGSFPDIGAVVGPLCPSKPLLLGTGWGHRVHRALTLSFLPPVVSIFFLTRGNKRECHQHTLVLSVPQIASHGAVPPLSLHTSLHSCLTGRHQPRAGGCQHPPWPRTSRAAPTCDGPCTWSCCWERR